MHIERLLVRFVLIQLEHARVLGPMLVVTVEHYARLAPLLTLSRFAKLKTCIEEF